MTSADRTVENRWEIRRIVRPRRSSRILSNSAYSARASSAAVGSSRMMKGAFLKNARASAIRCH